MVERITIPIFPLPNVVFFPKTFLPLHIFEPRYRTMIKDALNGNRLIGMTLLQDGWEKDYYGNPSVFATGCVGKIIETETLEDGRYNIILYGLSKFVIKKQFYNKSYRRAEVEYQSYRNPSLPTSNRSELINLLHQFAKHIGDQGQIESLLGNLKEDDALVNAFSFSLDFTPLEKQYLLESELLSDQCRRLIDLIHFQLHNKPAWVSAVVGSHRKN